MGIDIIEWTGGFLVLLVIYSIMLYSLQRDTKDLLEDSKRIDNAK